MLYAGVERKKNNLFAHAAPLMSVKSPSKSTTHPVAELDLPMRLHALRGGYSRGGLWTVVRFGALRLPGFLR
jgi:hypothetical protein